MLWSHSCSEGIRVTHTASVRSIDTTLSYHKSLDRPTKAGQHGPTTVPPIAHGRISMDIHWIDGWMDGRTDGWNGE